MFDKNLAEILVETLIDWGVDTVFGIPGDGINGFMEALRKNQDRIRVIQTRHEEAAAFMACGWAKYTGKLGVCFATSGPGAIHLLNGLYDAKMDGQPVLAITGNQFHDLMGTHGQQDVNVDRLFEDVTHYNVRVMGPNHIESVANIACRTALNYRRVSHLTISADLQDQKPSKKSRTMRNVEGHVQGNVEMHYKSVPLDDDLDRAAEILNSGEKIAILAGRGCFGATDEVLSLAKKLNAPIIKPLLGKAVVPDDNPYTTGSIGLLGTRPSQEAMENCDRLLMVGTSFPYIEFLPEPGQARAVQIDNDPARIGLRYPIEVGLVGDAKYTLEALLPKLEEHTNGHFLKEAQKGMKEWNAEMERRGTDRDTPMKPQVIAHELGKRLDDDALVSCDSGTIATWWARHIPAKKDQMHTLSGNLATMACGLPYTIAGQVAYPDRQCVAFVGDGGLTMLMPELATCAKYELPVKVFVIKNNALGQIKWEQMVFEGNPEYAVDLQPIDFPKVAEGFGWSSFHIEDPETCGDIVDEALNTDGPVLVEAVVDPFVPPLPPKIKWEQAKGFAEALAKGEPHPLAQALKASYDKVRELI
ncbi:MAG: thiamine pyrophosphate-binding protein [Persicimonas sp.]